MSSQRLSSIYSRLDIIREKLGQHEDLLPRSLNDDETVDENSIAICGMLGRGKSSLINAFFGKHVIVENLPPALATSTIYHTIVRNALPTYFEAHTLDGSVVEFDSMSLSKLKEWNTSLDFIKIQVSSSSLPEDSQLVETPSFPSLDFDARTTLIIEKVNLVILVIDINLGLIQEESNFLKSLPKTIEQVVIVANKSDKITSEEADVLLSSISSTVKDLNLDTKVEVFAVSIKKHQNPQCSFQWTKLVRKITAWIATPTEKRKSPSRGYKEKIGQLLRATEELNESLKYISAKNQGINFNGGKLSDLKQTERLIESVINDQAQDILRVVSDSLRVFSYKLESSASSGRVDENSIKISLKSWIRKEQSRVRARLERHFKSVLEDTSYAVGRTYELSVELREIDVRDIRGLNNSNPLISSKIIEPLRLLGIGAGAITVLTSFLLSGTGGFIISLTVGGAIATGGWVFADTISRAGIRETISNLDLSSTILPEFRKDVDDNSRRLSELVHDAFSTAIEEARGSTARSSNIDISTLEDELKSIFVELDKLKRA